MLTLIDEASGSCLLRVLEVTSLSKRTGWQRGSPPSHREQRAPLCPSVRTLEVSIVTACPAGTHRQTRATHVQYYTHHVMR